MLSCPQVSRYLCLHVFQRTEASPLPWTLLSNFPSPPPPLLYLLFFGLALQCIRKRVSWNLPMASSQCARWFCPACSKNGNPVSVSKVYNHLALILRFKHCVTTYDYLVSPSLQSVTHLFQEGLTCQACVCSCNPACFANQIPVWKPLPPSYKSLVFVTSVVTSQTQT